MRVVQSETQAAKCRRQVSRVKLALRGLIGRERPGQSHLLGVIHHVLQRKQSGDVGLGLFDRAIQLFQLLARIRVFALHLDLVRPQPVHEFMRQDVGEERVEIHVDHGVFRQHAAGDRQQHAVKLRLLHVLEHDALAPLLLHHPIVIRQIVGGGLHAMRTVTGTQDLVHHADRRRRAQLRVAVLGINRQIVFNQLQVLRERGKFPRLLIVPQVDVSLKRRLISKHFIVVRFVRTDRDVERRVQIHPRHITFKVIVGKKRIRPRAEELLQRWIVRESRRLAQQVRGLGQVVFVLFAVRNELERICPAALPNDGEESLGLFLSRIRQRRYPALESRLVHVLGIEVRAQRLSRRNQRHEGLELIDIRPRPLVEPEIVQPRLAQSRLIFLQPGVERQVAAPILLHENRIHDSAGLNQLHQRLPVSVRELGGIHAERGRSKPARHSLKLRKTGAHVGLLCVCWHRGKSE